MSRLASRIDTIETVVGPTVPEVVLELGLDRRRGLAIGDQKLAVLDHVIRMVSPPICVHPNTGERTFSHPKGADNAIRSRRSSDTSGF